MYHIGPPRPPFFCNACCGSSSSGKLLRATKLGVCTKTALKLRGLLPVAGLLHGSVQASPWDGCLSACRAAMLPPRFSRHHHRRPGCTPGAHQRLLALRLDPWALARDLLVQQRTRSNVSTLLLLLCAWGETATPPRAPPSIRSTQSSFTRRL